MALHDDSCRGPSGLPDSNSVAEVLPRIGDSLAGYTLERMLGRGGMGVVFLATHRRLGRQDALKVLAPELAEDEGFRQRFIRESQLAASLDHPSIIPIYDADEDDGVLFIAMRYVDGSDLRDALRRTGRLTPERTAQVIEAVAGALDAAHGAGLVHRDVKPANILIQESDGRVFLSDFGVAKRTTSLGMTKTGSLIGSIDYCAPEQIQGESLDGRADTYSLGGVAFHCLTGHPPYPKDTEIAVIQAHLAEPAPALSTVTPSLPLALDGVLVTAMAKHREVRYASTGAFAAAFCAAVRGDPRARPTTLPPTAALVQADVRGGARVPAVPSTGVSAAPVTAVQTSGNTAPIVPAELDRGEHPARRHWRAAAVLAALLALTGAALAILALTRSDTSRPTSASAATLAGQPTFGSRVANVVRPLVAPQERVGERLAGLRSSAASFASVRTAASTLERATLRAQGAAGLLEATSREERTAKSSLVDALAKHARYAHALVSLPVPGALTEARARAITDSAAATHIAYSVLSDVAGSPCCPAMPVGRGGTRRLEVLAAREESPPASAQPPNETALNVFSEAIESYLVQSARGRTELASALSLSADCTSSPAALAARVGSVADNRQSLLDRLGDLRVPNDEAARVAALLRRSLSHSVEADRHYRDWLTHVRTRRPGSCSLAQNDDFALARQEDAQATSAKQAFVAAFNPMAARFDLRTWSAGEI